MTKFFNPFGMGNDQNAGGLGNKPKPEPETDLFGEYANLKGKFGFNYNKDYLKNLAKQKTEEDIANTVSDMYASGRQSGSPEGQSEYWATRNMKSAERGELAGIEDRANQDKYNQLGIYQWMEGNKHRDKSFDFQKDMANRNWQLQKDSLDFQKYQFEESQPSWLDDVFGGISALSGAIPFLKKGGEVEVPNYKKGGDVEEENLSPEEQAKTGETTFALVQEGEVINSNPTGDVFGRDNLKLINEAGNMVANMFGGGGSNSVPQKAQADTNPQKKKLLGGDPNKGLLGRLGDAVSGMFADGGEIQPGNQPMMESGSESGQQKLNDLKIEYDRLMTQYQWAKQQGAPNAEAFLQRAQQIGQMLEQAGSPIQQFESGGQVDGEDDNYKELIKRYMESKKNGEDDIASQYENEIKLYQNKMNKKGGFGPGAQPTPGQFNDGGGYQNTQPAPKKKITIEESR